MIRRYGGCLLAACRHVLVAYGRTIAIGRRVFAAQDAALPPESPDALVVAVLAALREGGLSANNLRRRLRIRPGATRNRRKPGRRFPPAA